MRLRRDSLLIKIIFYNDIAIILTSLMIAGILTFITFKDMDSETKRMTREKVKTLERFYDFYLSSLKDDIYQMSNSGYLVNETASVRGEINYNLVAARLKSQLDKQNYRIYKDAVITLVNYQGKVLGESGRKGQLEKLSIERSPEYMGFLMGKKYQIKSVYQEAVDKHTVIRVSVPNYLDKGIKELVMSFTIEDSFLERAKEILGLEDKHRIFYNQGNEYFYGDVDQSKLKDIDMSYSTFTKGKEYLYKEFDLGRESYYVGIYPLEDSNGEIIGSLGIAISKTDVTQMKALVLLMIASITIGLILFNSAIFGKIFYKMLNPLVEVAEASNKIARGEKNVSLKVQGAGEIRSMVKSFKKMIHTIESNEKALRDKNLKLQENITRIDVIEKLLMGIYGEEDIFAVIKTILRALTSEVGLGYSRGVFLRYSREIESLVGEYSMVNNKLIDEGAMEDAIGTFRFQRESLDEIISYIKISIREESLLAESLLEKKIIYYNDKCYKYNLGNELLQSMGFNNFIIIPIYSNDRDYGCIILDNFMKKRQITPEEVELLNLLILNLGTHFKNKSLEEEKIENERALTIGKLSEKFLDGREIVLNNIYSLLEEAKGGAPDIAEKLIAMERELINIKREDSILTEYSDMKEYEMEVFVLDELLSEIYLENKEEMSNKGISVSLFVKYNGRVYGDRKELKKVFLEVLDNAVDAVMLNGKANKKINVIISKGKNTEKLRVRIVDNGIGMNETELQTIGEPFVSYKKDSAGLGLSIAFRIIKHHRGIMKILSNPDEGTEVKITLNDYKEENR